MYKGRRRIKELIESIKKALDLELPFEEFNTSKPINEEVFLEYFAPYFQDSIEDCFCAKVRCEGKQDFVVQFDTGECLELQLSCKIRE